MIKIMTLTKWIYLILFVTIIANNIKYLSKLRKYEQSYIQQRQYILYDSPILFQLRNRDIETKALTILSPQCLFENINTKNDCKTYSKLFLDADCAFNQTINITDCNGNPDFSLFMSSFNFFEYDSRLQVYEKINVSWINLQYSILCENNNLCTYVTNFIFSYKNWNKVPINGNNVTLNCSLFRVYSFI
jgi:hypothetical protein